MEQVRDLGLHEKVYILAGVGPLASARSAEWIRSHVAGVHIPDSVINRLRGTRDQAQEGVNICKDVINRIREIEGVHGIHIMAYRQEHRVAEIVDSTGILQGRTPWHPGVIKEGNPAFLHEQESGEYSIPVAGEVV
jgi:methylenetetrahydrofolate reductase (NADPH)